MQVDVHVHYTISERVHICYISAAQYSFELDSFVEWTSRAVKNTLCFEVELYLDLAVLTFALCMQLGQNSFTHSFADLLTVPNASLLHCLFSALRNYRLLAINSGSQWRQSRGRRGTRTPKFLVEGTLMWMPSPQKGFCLLCACVHML